MTPNDLIDSKPREGPPATGDEHGSHRSLTSRVIDHSLKDLSGLLPKRTDAPLVAFAVQPDAWLGAEIEVFDAEVGDLLDSCARVVEQ